MSDPGSMSPRGFPGVPGYQLLAEIGRGGFGTVYRAVQLSVGREVALKVVAIGAFGPEVERRFRAECTSIGRMSWHPHIVPLYDAGVTPDGTPYLVMELMTGGSLGEQIGREGPLGATEVVRVGVQLADALSEAHEADVLHRDVKPDNCFVDRRGGVRLGDFGIATLVDGTRSVSGSFTGTFAYTAPERFRGDRASPSSDLFSLAATLHALLSGRSPFVSDTDEDSPAAIMWRIGNDPPPALSPAVPAGLVAVLDRALSKDPADRFASAAEFRDALMHVDMSAVAPATSDHAATADPEAAVQRPAQQVTSWVPPRRGPTVQEPAPPVAQAPPPPSGDTASVAPRRHADDSNGAPPTLPPPTVPVSMAVAEAPAQSPAVADSESLSATPAAEAGAEDDSASAEDDSASVEGPEARTAAASELAVTNRGAVTSPGPVVADPPRRQRRVLVVAAVAVGILVLAAFALSVGGGGEGSGADASATSTPVGRPAAAAERGTVPSVVAEPEAKAVEALNAAGFKTKVVSRRHDERTARGAVINQDPAPGGLLAKGAVVKLSVSKGPAPLTVPNVVWRMQDDAVKALQDLGLKVLLRSEASTLEAGTVVRTSPAAGTEVEKGKTVLVFLSPGPPATVPPTTGRTPTTGVPSSGGASGSSGSSSGSSDPGPSQPPSEPDPTPPPVEETPPTTCWVDGAIGPTGVFVPGHPC